jgi:hypothetical protein
MHDRRPGFHRGDDTSPAAERMIGVTERPPAKFAA